MNAMTKTDWIAVDWGTSRLRAFAMKEDGDVLARGQSDKGMGGLNTSGFEPALMEIIQPWLNAEETTQVVACGMVGARQGWIEAPYRQAPCTPIESTMIQAPVNDNRMRVSIVSGISQLTPPDVMRGEETQIAGFLSQNPDFDGILCLPGTHTKWVKISAGEIVGFVTFMTGELFALLSQNSVLKHTVGADGWDDGAFQETLSDAISKPQHVSARLFSLRATSLLGDMSPATARARLSGALIGIELAGARSYWLGQDIAVIGAERLSQIYIDALTAQGCSPTLGVAQDMTLAGLSAAYKNMKANP